MKDRRLFGSRILDFITGRSRMEVEELEAGREDIRRNNAEVTRSLDTMFDRRDAVVTAVDEFSEVLHQLAKDLGHVDGRKKGKSNAKTPARSGKT